MLNMMWAIRMVSSFRGWPIETNRVSREAPSTISGVAIGRKMKRFVGPRPRKV